jgi:hypothetical protein
LAFSAPPGLALGICFQCRPSQRSMSVRTPTAGWSHDPTAHALADEADVTAARSSGYAAPAGFGLPTLIQAEPFQCSIRVLLVVPFQ